MISLILLSIAPVFIIAFYIYFRDKYEKEPWRLLLTAMALGVFIALPVVFAEQAISAIGPTNEGVLNGFWNAFMVAALCEESFKLIVLYLLIWKRPEFNEKFDGIVYATFVSLGFAGIENILYVTGNGMATGISRALTAVPAHALFGVTMGYFFGLAKFYPKRQLYYLRMSFFLPFLLHGIYDFILMAGLDWLLLAFIPFIIYLWVVGFKKMKELNSKSIYRTDLALDLDFRKVKEFNSKNDVSST